MFPANPTAPGRRTWPPTPFSNLASHSRSGGRYSRRRRGTVLDRRQGAHRSPYQERVGRTVTHSWQAGLAGENNTIIKPASAPRNQRQRSWTVPTVDVVENASTTTALLFRFV